MRPKTNDDTGDESVREARPGIVYGLGLTFIVLMTLLYIKADVFLGWLETIIRALFM